MSTAFPSRMAQGKPTALTAEDLANDQHGYTNPNLHRRMDIKQPLSSSLETAPREYKLCVGNVDSLRETTITYHDEESTSCEIP